MIKEFMSLENGGELREQVVTIIPIQINIDFYLWTIGGIKGYKIFIYNGENPPQSPFKKGGLLI